MIQFTSAGFAAASPQWWCIAAQWLGWRPHEFWQATPSELRDALAHPKTLESPPGPSMDIIVEMLEREKNG